MEFCQDAQFKLEAVPSSTTEYVESLSFLDTIQEKVVFSVVFIYIPQITSNWLTSFFIRVCYFDITYM